MIINREDFSIKTYETDSEVAKSHQCKIIQDGLIDKVDSFLLKHQFTNQIESDVLDYILEFDLDWLYEMIGEEI